MFNIIKKFNILLHKRQRVKLSIIYILMVIGAFLETIGVTLLLPLVSAIMNKDIVKDNQYVKWICEFLNINSIESFVIFVIAVIIFIFIFKNSFLFLEYYIQARFVYNNKFLTQRKLLYDYLHRPYQYYLHASTGEVMRIFTNDVRESFELLTVLLSFFTEIIIFVAIIIVLFIIDPLMTFLVSIILGLLMIGIAVTTKPILKRAALSFQKNSAISNKWIMQSISGIKELKVAQKEDFFNTQYTMYGFKSVSAEKKRKVLDNLPRLLIETVCIAGMLLVIIILVMTGRELSLMVPQLSAFAMAAVRLMPTVNRLSSAYNSMSYFEPSLDKLLENLQEIKRNNIVKSKSKINESDIELKDFIKNDVKLKKAIELSNITYSYPESEEIILKDASMLISVGKSVGLIGASGEGKTTTVDILLGLLKPIEGHILVDGVDIQNNYSGWLSQIAYIPQMIFMLDDTIRANIAFGYEKEDISETRIWTALEDAKLANFVRSLPKGLDTEIGERGVRLSGGQRQRIGIARALYTEPQVLIFDEATSALDNETESAIMESINSLHGKKTMVIIAHRLGTIKGCDIVYRVQGGKIIRENNMNLNN